MNKRKIQLLRAMAANNGPLEGPPIWLNDDETLPALIAAGLAEATPENACHFQLTRAGRDLVASWRAKDRPFDVWLEVPDVGEVGLTVWAPDVIEALRAAMVAVGMPTGPGAKVPRCRAGESIGWPVKAPVPTKCACELRNRAWNPLTRKCETCLGLTA